MSELLDAAEDARHDLGKYICMNQRWLGDDASPAQRLEAVQADLLRTQSGPGGDVDAFTLWARLSPPLEGAGQEVARVEANMLLLSSLAPGIRSGVLSAAELETVGQACRDIQDALKTLTRRLRRES